MSFLSLLSTGVQSNKGGSSFTLGRVTKVILGPYLEDGSLDSDYNDPTDIGAIRYTIENAAQEFSVLAEGNPIAKPAWTFFKSPPVVNEYVYIISGPSTDLNESGGAQASYYLPAFALWQNVNHNAFPNLSEYALTVNIQNSISNEQVARGGTRTTATASMQAQLGNDFVERGDIRSLQPFPGDILFEGRYGQSIRFGSSNRAQATKGQWWQSKNEGEPITIIRNGQRKNITRGQAWDPVVEDVNSDGSIICLAAGQSVAMTDIISNFRMDTFGIRFNRATTRSKFIPIVPLSNAQLSPKLTDDLVTSSLSPSVITIVENSHEPEQNVAELNKGATNNTVSTTVSPINSNDDNIAGQVVTGEKYASTNVAYVKLQLADAAGNIIASAETTATALQTAYTETIKKLKATGQVGDTKIPLLSQLATATTIT